jgi:hypothetical protein
MNKRCCNICKNSNNNISRFGKYNLCYIKNILTYICTECGIHIQKYPQNGSKKYYLNRLGIQKCDDLPRDIFGKQTDCILNFPKPKINSCLDSICSCNNCDDESSSDGDCCCDDCCCDECSDDSKSKCDSKPPCDSDIDCDEELYDTDICKCENHCDSITIYWA